MLENKEPDLVIGACVSLGQMKAVESAWKFGRVILATQKGTKQQYVLKRLQKAHLIEMKQAALLGGAKSQSHCQILHSIDWNRSRMVKVKHVEYLNELDDL